MAIYAPEGGLVEESVRPGLDRLRARGPDGRGIWCAPDGVAALGHTRLAVMDPRTGAQPMADETGRLRLVTNGEFYGYRELRRELIAAGHRLRTGSDSEIALPLFARHGTGLLARLRGEFAFVIWDDRTRELFAARDRFGVKPLYYARHRGRLLLASEIKALLACGVPARWDSGAFAAHLQLGLPPDRTLFAGVRQVPPGCYLTAGPRGVTVRSYWDPDYPPTEDRAGDTVDWDHHVADLRAAIDDAVAVRTIADTQVAYHLSGGIDSTAVVATAARGGPVTAYTVRFPAADFDESARAARTAATLGLTHHYVDYRPADYAELLRATVRAGEQVLENAHGVARLLHSRAISEHGFKVALGGEGGDELFAGYPQFHRDIALDLDPRLAERARHGYSRLEAIAPPYLRTLLDTFGDIPTWVLDRHLAVTAPVRAILRPEFAAELDHTDACAPLLADAGDRLRGRGRLHRSMYLFVKTRLPNYILLAERLDAANAVETRLPFLDHRLFAIAARTPLRRYMFDGASKYPLRAALADRIPGEVAAGGKRGFFAPPVLREDDLIAVLRELGDTAALRANPFFDPAAVRRLLDRTAARPAGQRASAEPLLQLAASIAVLGEEFGMSTAEPATATSGAA
ncbi:asparagine synthase (glutamine-hydrolyzing) [Nocardia sp. NPDC047038]|uniref:asparagine synthase (glutamine-hydrolyzing) n=1 Tax=Nocardia sp. NPDC047038 TaxID=3154338 RepID=UPI0033EFBC5C